MWSRSVAKKKDDFYRRRFARRKRSIRAHLSKMIEIFDDDGNQIVEDAELVKWLKAAARALDAKRPRARPKESPERSKFDNEKIDQALDIKAAKGLAAAYFFLDRQYAKANRKIPNRVLLALGPKAELDGALRENRKRIEREQTERDKLVAAIK